MKKLLSMMYCIILLLLLAGCADKNQKLILTTYSTSENFGILKPDFLYVYKDSIIQDTKDNILYKRDGNNIINVNTNEISGSFNTKFGKNHNQTQIILNFPDSTEYNQVIFTYSKNGKLFSSQNLLDEQSKHWTLFSENGIQPYNFHIILDDSKTDMYINEYLGNYDHYLKNGNDRLFKIEYKNPSLSVGILNLEEKKRTIFEYINFDANGDYELETHFFFNNKIASWDSMAYYEQKSKNDYLDWNDSYFASVSKYDFTTNDDGYKYLKQFSLTDKLIPGSSVVLIQYGVGRLYITSLFCFKVVDGKIDYTSCYKIELNEKPKLSQ